jgi:hypothetical protein
VGIFIICPHCQARVPLPGPACGHCGADLRHLPREQRRYFWGAPEPGAAVPVPKADSRPIPRVIAGNLPEKSQVEEVATPAFLPEIKDVTLCEALDRILHKGAVLFGEVMISVADIDLVYLGLQVILASMETARGWQPAPEIRTVQAESW